MANVSVASMIQELIHQICVIVVFMIAFLHRFPVKQVEKNAPFYGIHWRGVLFFSMLAVITVLFPISINNDPNIIIDLRAAAVVLSGIYLGPIDSLLIGMLTIMIRIGAGGAGVVPWIPPAILFGPVSWYIWNYVRRPAWNRSIALCMLGLVITGISAVSFSLISLTFSGLAGFSPFLEPENFGRVYVPLFVANPVAIMAIDWTLRHIEAYQSKVAKLQENVFLDEMTGLYNYRSLQVSLDDAIEKADREHSAVSLVMLDLDYFKAYNDTFGHRRGDRALIELGIIIRDTVKKKGMVARYGGEEFAVILPGMSLDFAVTVAERIRKNVESYHFWGEEKLATGRVTISAGVAEYPGTSDTKGSLIEDADKALYIAKNSGRSKVYAMDVKTAGSHV